jgi:ubiquinone/menaquinone biosynthesis C-methylase UbiE
MTQLCNTSGLAELDEKSALKLLSAEESSFWSQGRNELIVSMIRRCFPHARTLLEVGCGGGIVLAALRRAFPDLTLVGGDADPAALRLARQRLQDVELVELDACRLPYDGEFDVVAICDVLEHLDQDEVALSEIFRAVRPGGGLLITVPQGRFLWSAADTYAQHRRRYRRREIDAKVRAAGFEIKRGTSFVSTILPLMMISRLGQRSVVAYDPVREFERAERFASILHRALAAERWAIERGVNLPVGGSILLIATKAEAA